MSLELSTIQDTHRREHFEINAKAFNEVSVLEAWRISRTVDMVPRDWRTILDVGCGDGRVGQEMMKRGHYVVGLDWSVASAARFPGERIVCDLRKPWPLRTKFDGAICCEVVEHLSIQESQALIDQLFNCTRLGFLITVPANETLDLNTVKCQSCQRSYHIWGHLQSFDDWSAIDDLVGQKATRYELIRAKEEIRVSLALTRWQKRLGFAPFESCCLCPYCGTMLAPIPLPGLLFRGINKILAGMQRLGSPFRKPGGWFASLYLHRE